MSAPLAIRLLAMSYHRLSDSADLRCCAAENNDFTDQVLIASLMLHRHFERRALHARRPIGERLGVMNQGIVASVGEASLTILGARAGLEAIYACRLNVRGLIGRRARGAPFLLGMKRESRHRITI